MAGGFNVNTRRKIIQLATYTAPTGGGILTPWQLPKTGLLGKIFLRISAVVGATVTTVNPLGIAAAVRRVRLTANSGIDIFNVSGVGWAYLVQEALESEYYLATTQNQGRTVITAATFNLDMVIPLGINSRDNVGYILLQNEQTILTLTVEQESNINIVLTGGGATVLTVTPYLELFTVPVDPRDYPPVGYIQQYLEDSQAVAGAGQFIYQWQRGNTYMQVMHGLGLAAAGAADGFNRVQVRVNQSDYLQDTDTNFLDLEQRWYRGRARALGAILVDLMASSGLGNYGPSRDFFDSSKVTDLASVITATGAGTLFTVRRQLVSLS